MSVLDESLAIARLIADGDISPEMLQGLQDAAILQEASENQYDMVELEKGKIADRGKFKLVPKELHGGRNLPQTIDGLLMDAAVQRTGEHNVIPLGETPRSQAVRMAADRILAPAGASQLAKVGLRAGAVEQLDGEERLLRAADRLVEMDRNFDPVSGARLDGVGLDGGHIADHHNNPELSSARENMRMENKNVNRTKGARSGEDAVRAYGNSILKRLKSGELTPEELAYRYQYNDSEMGDESLASSGEGSAGIGHTDNNQGKVFKLSVDTDGGDFNLESDFMKRNGKNGNGSTRMRRR